VFLLGVGVFTGASLLYGLAPGPIALIAARAVQGAGAALMFPQTLIGIQLSFQGAERARAERGARHVDVAGVATLSGAVLLVVVPLVLGRAEGWPARSCGGCRRASGRSPRPPAACSLPAPTRR
jgi:MFS family permease